MNKSKTMDRVIKVFAVIAVFCTIIGAMSFFGYYELNEEYTPWGSVKSSTYILKYRIPKGLGILELILYAAPSILVLLYVFCKNTKVKSIHTITAVMELLMINNMICFYYSHYSHFVNEGKIYYDSLTHFYGRFQGVFAFIYSYLPLIAVVLLIIASWIIRCDAHKNKKGVMTVVGIAVITSAISPIVWRLFNVLNIIVEFEKQDAIMIYYWLAIIIEIICTAIAFLLIVKPDYEKKIKKAKLTLEARLLQLAEVYEKGLISKEEYEEKRRSFLESF